MASKGKRSQNTDFTASVVAVDIGGGIPFGVAQLLRQRQGILEGSAVVNHLGQHKIGGAVENTRDLIHLIGRQALIQRAQNRNTAAYAGFKQEIQVPVPGNGQQLVALGRHQFLVGGDHTFSRQQAALDKIIGRIQSTHGFHHNGNGGIVFDISEVLGEPVGERAAGEFPQIQYATDFKGLTGLVGDAAGVFCKTSATPVPTVPYP